MSSASRPSGAASAASVTGPEPFEPAAQDFDQRLLGRPVAARHSAPARRSAGRAAHRATARGIAAAARRRPTASRSRTAGVTPAIAADAASGKRVASVRRSQLAPASAPALAGRGFGLGQKAEPDQGVVQFVGGWPASGQASSRTRAIASGSSRPSSAASSGASQRRPITAWVRRSSSGASSR